ncbi:MULTISPECIES: RagB/SusD family nutrient uptake outer membrane protein [unclassified Myroides]|uniref:RagB/SusD family nutrient uptake outer membrane protein n=1 Tax=unclassified Myroides TaxID=2642485 RepID=UPI0015F8B9E7|nr:MULTISPECIES: RagB/SusD family nutrient uptake outer membrane protein [unclassified Myroides]MBB1150562.1 RagB/SusD family nutrient uptake outer membrane protein [Myroides sp. NP-2]MDM1407207.1 RagB/SusD family nutrient uptake outer membrane protein [Myroides sp. DF42-4-2]
MKNYSLYTKTLFLLFSFVLISCDLDTSPTDAVEEKEVFKTVSGSEKVLNGSWGQLMETFSTYANPGFGSFLRTSDAMGNDVVLQTNKYGFGNHYQFSALYGKGGTNSHSWNLSYKTINNMNNILAYIDDSKGDAGEKRRIKGQAYALRGFMYLHLASSYAFAIDKDPNALAVPIYLKPTTANTQPGKRATVTEVYNQALADLEEALVLIPEGYVRKQKFQIDHTVVLGLLSRANLYARNWQKAKDYSDRLLVKNDYLMTENEYKTGFNDVNNREWIWGHPQTPDQSGASYQFHYLDVTSTDSFYYSFNADPHFKDLFDDGDYRKSMINWAPDPGAKIENASVVWMRYAKFKFKAGQLADIVLMRTSEIYLINAEAKARLNDGDAINKLNEVKRARHAALASNLSGNDLVEAILLERRKELFGEGFSLVDIVRNQKSVVRKKYELDKVDYTYVVKDEQGKEEVKTKVMTANGHYALNLPDQSPFVANSPYYLYQIPAVEERENPNL